MLNDSITALADFITRDDIADAIDLRPELIELLQPLLAPTILLDLAASLEICPMHYCDIEICADDNELDCAEYRN